METAQALNDFVTRTEKEVIGIAENNFGVQISDQVPRQDALHRRLRADRHEDWSFDIAMRGVENACARAGFGAGCLKLEAKHRLHCKVDCLSAWSQPPINADKR